MKKILSLLICSTALFAGVIKVDKESPIVLHAQKGKQVVIQTNFTIHNGELIIDNPENGEIKSFLKGVVFVPKVKLFNVTIILAAVDGSIYTINIDSRGKESTFSLNDPMQVFSEDDTSEIALSNTPSITKKEVNRIIKGILNNKKISGFTLNKAPQLIQTPRFSLTRTNRLDGAKYVVDLWRLTANGHIYLDPSELYTDGVIAVAPEKKEYVLNESGYIIVVLNKNTLRQGVRKEVINYF